MQLSRRELLKLGAFGSAALLLPAERVARTELALKNRIAASRLPAPFSVPLTVPPVLTPVRSTADTDFYAITQQAAAADILPGLKTSWATTASRRDRLTAPNAYMGLAGLYLIEDDLERSLPIPHGRYDVPLAIKDALFTNTGELIFDDNDASGMFGDVILVNGKPWPAMPVERRKYRFRILNASISRSYELALSTGDPFTVIGTDGGLMPAPQVAQTIRHGMAERYEVVIDFAKYPIGTRIVLRNLQPDNNREFPNTDVIMAFDVTSDATDTTDNEVPAVLNPNNATMNLQPSQAKTTRLMDFKRQGGEWAVNGRTWEDVINSGFTLLEAHPALNDVEIWTFRNNSNGWFHPVHIHLVDFKVLDRNGQPPAPYERGPKDVVYLGEGETVRMITRFGPNLGRYMMHCHNLVHEDHDMMVQFEVGTGGPDPIHAAPARNLPAPPL